jgi:hypothetical protein
VCEETDFTIEFTNDEDNLTSGQKSVLRWNNEEFNVLALFQVGYFRVNIDENVIPSQFPDGKMLTGTWEYVDGKMVAKDNFIIKPNASGYSGMNFHMSNTTGENYHLSARGGETKKNFRLYYSPDNSTFNALIDVTNNGNVLIGTTTDLGYKLDVNGTARINGNLVVAGDTSTGSDIRFKDKLSDHRIALSDIAEAPLFTFKWNDREDNSVHLGSSAQYWEKVAPWLVKGEDFKTLDYSTLGVAIGISLANKTLNHEERIKILENKVNALEAENRRLRYGS